MILKTANMQVQKEISQLRDDIQTLFSELTALLGEKRELFSTIREHSAKIRYSKDHDTEGEISLLIKRNSSLIEQAGSLNFSIADKKHRICSLCGIGETRFDEYFSSLHNEEYAAITLIEQEIDDHRQHACTHYDEICRQMEDATRETENQMQSLNQIRNILDITQY